MSEFSVRYVWVSWKLRPWETMKEKKFFLSLKMFYGHAMLIGGKPERIEIFIVSGLSLSRPVDTKADLKLNNNIIATPSSNLILTPLDECQSWWALTIRDMRRWRYNLCALRLVRCKLPLRHWNLRNLTLQQECYLTTGMLPYKHSSRALEIFTAYTVLSHGSIMLPPRQPRVFARLARWQLLIINIGELLKWYHDQIFTPWFFRCIT